MPLANIKKGGVLNNVNQAVEIFSEYGEFIRRIIRHHVGDDARGDDLFQDFFLSLASKPLPADIKNIKSYLYRAITHDVVDATRRLEKYQAIIHKYADNSDFSINKNCPENALITIEEINKMFKLIEGLLPPSEAQAIILRYGHNYDIKEVAKKMKVNRRSVSRYISAGLNKVRQVLTPKTEELQ